MGGSDRVVWAARDLRATGKQGESTLLEWVLSHGDGICWGFVLNV